MNDDLNPKRRKLALFFSLTIVLLLIIALIFWVVFFRFRAFTNDAYVEGNQVFITPLQTGFITSIHTDDTFLVQRGQLLVELDRTDSLIAYETAAQELAQSVREVCQAFHQVFALRAEIDMKKAELIRMAQDFQHRDDLLDSEGISLEDYEHAVAFLRSSYFSLKMTQTLFLKALAFIQSTTIKTHPLVQKAKDRVRDKWVQLYRCQIYSPVDGLAAQRKGQVGMWVEAGKPLLSVIPLDQIWVNANFKETQMKYMRIGQNVRLTSDLYGDNVVFQGKVVGLPGGAGNAFSLLPPQNLSGNWIKIVQRVPVRVELNPEELKQYPLRLGLSMEATVFLEEEGKLVPTTTDAPLYDTSIFEKEEVGVCEEIEKIIQANLDPKLEKYTETVFEMKLNDDNISQYLPLIQKIIGDFSAHEEPFLSLRNIIPRYLR